MLLLLLVAHVYGSEVATGKFHDYSGFLVFIIAFLGLKIMGNILSVDKGEEKEDEKKTEDREEESDL